MVRNIKTSIEVFEPACDGLPEVRIPKGTIIKNAVVIVRNEFPSEDEPYTMGEFLFAVNGRVIHLSFNLATLVSPFDKIS